MKLNDEEIAEHVTSVPEWQLEEKRISRRYKFAAFPLAIKFVNQVANIAEQRNHHPFISIDYLFVTLTLTSWHAGGLTEDDFAQAQVFDELYTRVEE